MLGRGGGNGICVLPASHGYSTDTLLGSCVFAQYELWDLAKPGSGDTFPNIVLIVFGSCLCTYPEGHDESKYLKSIP